MGYCEITDIQKMLPDRTIIQLTDDEKTGAIGNDRLMESIDSASEEIDAYIGAVVKLPISGDVPPILGKLSADITVYNLYSRLQEKIPDTREQRYRNAVRILEKIASGDMSFGLQPEPETPTSPSASMVCSRKKIFSENRLEMY